MLSTKRGRRGVIPPRQHAQTRINLHQNKYSPLFKTTAPPFFTEQASFFSFSTTPFSSVAKKKNGSGKKKKLEFVKMGI